MRAMWQTAVGATLLAIGAGTVVGPSGQDTDAVAQQAAGNEVIEEIITTGTAGGATSRWSRPGSGWKGGR